MFLKYATLATAFAMACGADALANGDVHHALKVDVRGPKTVTTYPVAVTTIVLTIPAPVPSTHVVNATRPITSIYVVNNTSPITSTYIANATRVVTSVIAPTATGAVPSTYVVNVTSPITSIILVNNTGHTTSTYVVNATSPVTSTAVVNATVVVTSVMATNATGAIPSTMTTHIPITSAIGIYTSRLAGFADPTASGTGEVSAAAFSLDRRVSATALIGVVGVAASTFLI